MTHVATLQLGVALSTMHMVPESIRPFQNHQLCATLNAAASLMQVRVSC